MKKVFVFILSVALLVTGLIPICANADEPTAIEDAADFLAMTADGNYYLANDINFGGTVYTNNIYTEAFTGTLDGKGFKLYNFSLTLEDPASGNIYGGIFRSMSGATVKDLQIGTSEAPVSIGTNTALKVELLGTLAPEAYTGVIDNVVVYANVVSYSNLNIGYAYTGGLFGTIGGMQIFNSEMHGSVQMTTTQTYNKLGGFSGQFKGGASTILNSRNYANITAGTTTSGGRGYAGGFLSEVKSGTSGVVMKGCVNYGEVTATSPAKQGRCGGMISHEELASSTGITIENCFNFGTIHAKTWAGGIMGYADQTDVTIRKCVNRGTITGQSGRYGPIIGTNNGGKATVSNNFDESGTLDAGEVSNSVKVKGVQVKPTYDYNETSVFDIRFIGTVDALDYVETGFEIEVYYTVDDEAVSRTIPVKCNTVYDSIHATVGNSAVQYTLEDLGEASGYIVALSVTAIPATKEAGTVTFIFRSYAKTDGGSMIYGNSAIYAFSEGTLLFSSAVPVNLG